MTAIASVQSGLWSDAATWDSGVPANDDSVTITTGHNVEFDVDQSAFADGLAGLVIQSGAKLFAKHSAAGTYVLKIKTGCDLAGTIEDGIRGHLVATATGATDSTAPLPQDRKFIILLQGTAKLLATNLQCNLIATEPAYPSVRTYGKVYGPAVGVDTVTGVLDLGETPPAEGTAVCFHPDSVPPTGWEPQAVFYIRQVSGTTCKLALQNSDETVIIPEDTGMGDIYLYTGWELADDVTWGAGKNIPNILEDVQSDIWTTGVDVIMLDTSPGSYDRQRNTVTEIGATALTLGSAVDSQQFPMATIFLRNRNVAIRSAGTTSTQPIVLFGAGDTHGGHFGEISNIGGSGTTYSGYGIQYGAGATVSIIAACTAGLRDSNGHTVTRIIGCNTGLSHSMANTVDEVWCGDFGLVNSSRNAVGFLTAGTAIDSGSSNIVTLSKYAETTDGGIGNRFTQIISATTALRGHSGYADTVIGCSTALGVGAANTVENIIGATYAVNGSSGASFRRAHNCVVGIKNGTQTTLLPGGVLQATTCFEELRGVTGQDTVLDGTINGYLHAAEGVSNPNCGITIFNINQQAGYLGRWDAGGNTVTASYVEETHAAPVVPPYGVHVTTTENITTTPTFVQHMVKIPLWALRGQGLKITIYVRQLQLDFDATAVFTLSTPTQILAIETVANTLEWQTLELLTGELTSDTPLDLQMTVRGQSQQLEWFYVVESTEDQGYTFGDEDASKVLTTAAGAGTYQPVAQADVRVGVPVGVAPEVGLLVLPTANNVRAGINYGSSNEATGVMMTTGLTEEQDRVLKDLVPLVLV